ncbi:MAG: hypothetical protein Q9217_001775 [Psora testacea]
MTLILAALVALVRLLPYGPDTAHPSGQDHLSDFDALVKGRKWPDCNTQATLGHMARSFWDVISTLVDRREAQVIIQFLADAVDDTQPQGEPADNSRSYWKHKFGSPCEDDEVYLTGAIDLAQNEQTMQVKDEAASNQATQSESSQSAQGLLHRKQQEQERSKRRGRYCGGWWL